MSIFIGFVLACTLGMQAAPEAKPPAQPSQVAQDLAALLEPIRARHDVPALAAAIVSRGELEAVGVCGVRQRGVDTPVTLEDRFHLGSCSKAMTATLCAILVDKKELAWDVGLVDGLGAKAEGALPAWKNVQLQHLLTHRAGAPANLDAGGLWLRLCLSEATPRAQRELLVLGVLSAAPKSLPGEKFVYSNAGFALAGALAESTAKLDYEALMQRELFLPLGMTSAGFGPPGDGKSLDQPRGHTADGKTIPWGPRADNPAAIAPAGRVHCTISDWAKFIALHLDARNGRARLLPSESFVRMHTPAAGPGQSYAMGWVVTQRDWAGGEVLMHNGSNTMWFCVTWLAPKQDFAVLVCTNQGGPAAEAACDEASAALIEKHAQISKSAR